MIIRYYIIYKYIYCVYVHTLYIYMHEFIYGTNIPRIIVWLPYSLVEDTPTRRPRWARRLLGSGTARQLGFGALRWGGWLRQPSTWIWYPPGVIKHSNGTSSNYSWRFCCRNNFYIFHCQSRIWLYISRNPGTLEWLLVGVMILQKPYFSIHIMIYPESS